MRIDRRQRKSHSRRTKRRNTRRGGQSVPFAMPPGRPGRHMSASTSERPPIATQAVAEKLHFRPMNPAASVASKPAEPILVADQIGKSVSDSIKTAQLAVIRGQNTAKEKTKSFVDGIKGMGQAFTQRLSSLFSGGRRSTRRHQRKKTSSRRHRRVRAHKRR